jgi:hypothetical protein
MNLANARFRQPLKFMMDGLNAFCYHVKGDAVPTFSDILVFFQRIGAAYFGSWGVSSVPGTGVVSVVGGSVSPEGMWV